LPVPPFPFVAHRSRFMCHGLWRWQTFSKHPVKNGVLEVRMPKTEEAKKKAITVKID